jgi:hypothetical protein
MFLNTNLMNFGISGWQSQQEISVQNFYIKKTDRTNFIYYLLPVLR